MLDFRMYESSDFGPCIDLIRKGHDPHYSARRFRWLHEDCPWGQSKIALGTANGRVVGIYSVVPKVLCSQNEQYKGGRDVDPVVDPEYRGRGMFGRLLAYGVNNFEDIDLYFNFANPVSFKGFNKMGWQCVMRLPDRVHQLGFQHYFSLNSAIWALSRLKTPTNQSAATSELSPAELSQLLDTNPVASIGERLSVSRSADYIRWRYIDHPFQTYRYFKAEGHGQDFSLAICRDSPDQNSLLIIDLAGFGKAPHLADWLGLWKHLFPFYRVVTWATLPPSYHRGFWENPIGKYTGLPFLIRAAPGALLPEKSTKQSDWLLCRGDLEIL